ncbi:MAG: hypothetical protein HYW08_07600 [candidate division NC10 bacterium]|nr:hypothetical protein [candidate division NC10 bacterium]
MPLTKEQLLAEVEDLLRTMPPRETICHPTDENLRWQGRVAAVIDEWDRSKAISLGGCLDKLHGIHAVDQYEGWRKLLVLLHQARYDLRMQTLGPVNVALLHGMVFDYFDEVRKIIEMAKQDLFFVDPYLDAEFVSRYLEPPGTWVTTKPHNTRCHDTSPRTGEIADPASGGGRIRQTIPRKG